jgi:hypothetical protein
MTMLEVIGVIFLWLVGFALSIYLPLIYSLTRKGGLETLAMGTSLSIIFAGTYIAGTMIYFIAT